MLRKFFSTAAHGAKKALQQASKAAEASTGDAPTKKSKLIEALGPRAPQKLRTFTKQQEKEIVEQERWWNQNSGY